MKKIAPEVDSLMWTLAEEGNERAIDEFGSRNPQHRSELLRRIEMVKALRGEKKRTQEPKKIIPRFVPKQPKSHGPVYVVGALVLAAAGALAFAATTLMTPAPHGHASEPILPTNPPPMVKRVQQQGQAPIAETSPPDNKTTPGETPAEAPLHPGTLKIEHAPLLTVIDMISQVCHIQITAAPGMMNPDVVVDYRNMTAMEMLGDLGRQYGFTPLDQHDGSILVIPAVDTGQQGVQWRSITGGDKSRKIGG